EVRINATNGALQPHAGGLTRSWTQPSLGEIRWDQRIGTPNPDTGSFVWYNLAGAYDSNVALVLTDGETRHDNYERMAEVLRRMEIRGEDVQTNLSVHYGLVQWFLGKGVMAEPNTGFMQPYLAAVGALQQVVNDVDLVLAGRELSKAQADDEAREILASKQTLLVRPISELLKDSHALAGFLGRFDGELWQVDADEVRFEANPVYFLDRLYHYLDMEERPGASPSEKIWEQDQEILEAALAFYAEVEARTGASSFQELETLFGGEPQSDLSGGDASLWNACVASHRGFQVGLELLLMVPRIGRHSQFLDISVDESLTPSFPERFLDADESALCTRALSPPPRASADEIVTPMGGTYYAREAPHLPVLVSEGDHFDEGQPLFVIEVMKMFNKVLAPFSGTVTKNLMAGLDATVVAKGQAIFKIEPDERIVEEAPETMAARVRACTLSLLALQG
ncbi:MAG: biotin carboxylase, partial [bacterium]|nr:biotin carboxylase [bacterium]